MKTKTQLTVTEITKAANDDNFNPTEITEVKKEQKTPVLHKVGKWVVDNKWRILMGTYKVIIKWDVYKDKAAWLFELIKHTF